MVSLSSLHTSVIMRESINHSLLGDAWSHTSPTDPQIRLPRLGALLVTPTLRRSRIPLPGIGTDIHLSRRSFLTFPRFSNHKQSPRTSPPEIMSRSTSCLRKCNISYVRNNLTSFIFLVFFISINLGLIIGRFYTFRDYSIFVRLAKSCGSVSL